MTNAAYKNGERDAKINAIEEDIKNIKSEAKEKDGWQRKTMLAIIFLFIGLILERVFT